MIYQITIIQSFKTTCDDERLCQHQEQKIICKNKSKSISKTKSLSKNLGVKPNPESILQNHPLIDMMRFSILFSLPCSFSTEISLPVARLELVLIEVSCATLTSYFLSPRMEFVKPDFSSFKFSIWVVENLFKITDLCEGLLHNFLLDERK